MIKMVRIILIAISEFEKTTRMTLLDFIANMGGYLGLFAGFSFLSLVEMVYWIVAKFFLNLQKYIK